MRFLRALRHFPTSALKFAVFAAVCLVLLVGLALKISNTSLTSSRQPAQRAAGRRDPGLASPGTR